jgi:serine/threonine protein kinase
MPITSTAGLVEAVRRFGLLAPAQAEELATLQPRFADARALARELLQRGWLTPYQINNLVAGNGCTLLLGQYVLLERLGEGGMGQVLKARHQRLERLVALKLIRKERLTGRDAVQRFQREARAAARLSHPNLVTVYDADEVGGTHFFAMEYVEGTDLAKLVRKQGPLPVREACEYIRQAALGLQHAHEQGLVHRDIKPANLMLTTKGVVKVLDLGLARLATTAESSDPTDPVTHEGAVMGTPDYMAPEQATDSHAVDIRADLYSLGCTLHYLLTGKPPFPGGTLTDKLMRHQMHSPPRVETLRTDVPSGLAAIVARLLAKQPTERYEMPAQLALALEPFCGNQRPVAIPVGETVAYVPGEQASENTNTDVRTEGGLKPVAVPVATLAEKKTWWQEGLNRGRRLAATAWPPLARACRRRPWLVAGTFAALLLLGLLVHLAGHRGEDRGADGDGGNPTDRSKFDAH